MTRMPADEVETDVALVRRLLAGQFPRWAGLPIDPVESYGTDHDIYRLGDHLAVRLAARSPSSATGSTATPPSAPGGRRRLGPLPGGGRPAYYWDTNPGMVRQASHAVAQVLADPSPG